MIYIIKKRMSLNNGFSLLHDFLFFRWIEHPLEDFIDEWWTPCNRNNQQSDRKTVRSE